MRAKAITLFLFVLSTRSHSFRSAKVKADHVTLNLLRSPCSCQKGKPLLNHSDYISEADKSLIKSDLYSKAKNHAHRKIEQMRKIISFMHLSLDGFVAGPNGEMSWIKAEQEIFDYVGKRISEGDTALYGRVTYQLMESYWPTAGEKPTATKHDIEHAKWYKNVHKVVLSKTMNDAGLNNTEIIGDNLSDRINEIKQQAGKDILLFGSPTATHSLMQLNLIDGYWLFVNPIILGQGIPLFTGITDQIKLNLLTTHQFACGVTELNYTVER